MTERFIRQVSVLLTLIGTGLVGYILYARHSGSPLLCSTGGCEAVQSSRYSEIFGVPIAAFGLVGYATLLAAAVARGEWARTAQVMVALTAFLFSAYLVFVQVHLVGAICDWCLASDAVTTALVVTALLRIQASSDSGRPTVGPRRRG